MGYSTKYGSSMTTEEAFAKIQVREGGGWDWGVSGGGYGCVLKFEPIGLPNGLDGRCERGTHMTPRFMV